jgi:hypothetical protein
LGKFIGEKMVDITTILTVYKRPYTEEQIENILAQTLPSNIIIWQNENHIDITPLKKKYNFTHVHSTHNHKFHGRFTLPLLVNTPYVCVFDDDTMPGPKWYEKCKRSCEEKNAIIGRNGRIILKNFRQQGPIPKGNDIKVDFVGHSWFFKREWIHHMWKQPAYSFENGEDIHFCAAAKIHGNIDSYIAGSNDPLEQAIQDGKDGGYGADKFASYIVNKGSHTKVRQQVWTHWLKKGWKTIYFPEGM